VPKRVRADVPDACFLGRAVKLSPESSVGVGKFPSFRGLAKIQSLSAGNCVLCFHTFNLSPTTIISGYFSFGQVSVKLLKRLLPELILIKADQAQTLALHATLAVARIGDGRTSTWVRSHGQPVSGHFVHPMSPCPFASSSERYKSGWLRATFDPRIGAAL
jgi:hypothetical protein